MRHDERWFMSCVQTEVAKKPKYTITKKDSFCPWYQVYVDHDPDILGQTPLGVFPKREDAELFVKAKERAAG